MGRWGKRNREEEQEGEEKGEEAKASRGRPPAEGGGPSRAAGTRRASRRGHAREGRAPRPRTARRPGRRRRGYAQGRAGGLVTCVPLNSELRLRARAGPTGLQPPLCVLNMLLEARPRLAPPPLGLRWVARTAVARGLSGQLGGDRPALLGDGVLVKDLDGDRGASMPRSCIVRMGAPVEAARADVRPAARVA